MRYKVGFFLLFCVSLFGVEHVYLKAPDLSRENLLEVKAGVRPCRKMGFRIEAEPLEDKLLIHNYGYGGSGLTLCFGGAKEVIDVLTAHHLPTKTVAVLGAGVAGLATAYDLLQEGYEVHLYADQWIPNLTSNVAAGIWTPLDLPEEASESQHLLNQRVYEVSEARFLQNTGESPEFAGIHFLMRYKFSTATPGAIGMSFGEEEVVVHFDNGISKNGTRRNLLSIDGKLFMEDLYAKVQSKGAKLIERHFETRQDLLDLEEKVIINCTSLGSRALFDDEEFVPARGQIAYFKPQLGIDYILAQNVPDSTNAWVNIYPWSDRILIGGIREDGEDEAVVDPDVIEMLIRNAERSLLGEI